MKSPEEYERQCRELTEQLMGLQAEYARARREILRSRTAGRLVRDLYQQIDPDCEWTTLLGDGLDILTDALRVDRAAVLCQCFDDDVFIVAGAVNLPLPDGPFRPPCKLPRFGNVARETPVDELIAALQELVDASFLVWYYDPHAHLGLIAANETEETPLRRPFEASDQEILEDAVAVLTDFRQRCRLRDEKRRLQERVRATEKLQAIGELAAGIAHDLNNQLAPVCGYADLLRMRLADPELRELADNVAHASRKAAALTTQLIDFARRGRYRSLSVDLNQLAQEVVEELETALPENAELELALSDRPCLTTGDPKQLHSAIFSILENACDAVASGGRIEVRTERVCIRDGSGVIPAVDLPDGPYLCIAVTDSGTGMADAVRKRIFEPFFTTKGFENHTGMSLAAAYGAVKSHGGEIIAWSRPGEGSRFEVYLPETQKSAPEESGQSRTNRLTSKEKEESLTHVLIVDDEEMVREMAEEALTEFGHHARAFGDGGSAVEFLRETSDPVDAVLLDVVMPGMSAADTVRALLEVRPGLRIILASGYSYGSEIDRAMEAGAEAFVHKPYDIQELVDKIDGA